MTNQHFQSNLSFRKMSLEFRVRDLLKPPVRILKEAGVRPGMTILDFGCGPGGFAIAAARLVGPEGRVITLDRNPLALQSVERRALRRNLSNIDTLSGDSPKECPDQSVDMVLLYDVIHGVDNRGELLAELWRVLKPAGVLSVNDHHLSDETLIGQVTGGKLFRLTGRCKWSFQFAKEKML